MECPAVEHGKAVRASNTRRVAELIEEIERAGVWAQVAEILAISEKPEESFSMRLAKPQLQTRPPEFTPQGY